MGARQGRADGVTRTEVRDLFSRNKRVREITALAVLEEADRLMRTSAADGRWTPSGNLDPLPRRMTPPRREALRTRRGSPDDVTAVLSFFDEAVEWLVERGQAGQWGFKPPSENPSTVDLVRGWACGDRFWIAEADGQPVGTLILADTPSYAQPAESDEAYIMLLLTSRQHASEGIGSQLVDLAINESQRGGHSVLRVDCWAGAPGLVNWYQKQGFSPTRTYELDGWIGQIFRMPLPPGRPKRAG